MFESFPGFEDLPIFVEVEWQEKKRPVVVRLECWPQSRQAVLVCAFEDEPEYGEWLVMASNRAPQFVGSPHRLRFNRVVFDVATRQVSSTPDLKEQRLDKLQSIVRRAFVGDNFRVARLLELPDLPDEPRMALWCVAESLWCSGWQSQNATPFQFSVSPLYLNPQHAGERLMLDWNEPESDARFAWGWAQWNDEQRRAQLSGFDGDSQQLERVMTWILLGAKPLWELESGWTWSLRPNEETGGWLWNNAYSDAEPGPILDKWQKWLLSRFAPRWRADWIEKYSCVKQFWGWRALAEVQIDEPPTMHEQLESRLQLRQWLEDNAAPDEIEALLAL